MITSFADRETQIIWQGQRSRKLPFDIQPRALRILRMIDAAASLEDLKSPPSLRLHPLKADREGQYSVSINMKWRICFVWNDGAADNVEITNHYE